MSEDPAFRRVNGGTYRWCITVQLGSFPAPAKIAACRATDLSPVTTSVDGTRAEGAGVLFGAYKPTGKLGFSWPRSDAQLGNVHANPRFKVGYGLAY